MHFALFDILSVAFAGVMALTFLIRVFFKVHKDKCVNVCSGCSGGGCATRSFVSKNKLIEIHKI
jgi:hypothetical protein